MTGDSLDDVMALVALAALPEMGPRRLRALSSLGARRAWEAIASLDAAEAVCMAGISTRDPASLARKWREAAAASNPEDLYERHLRAGIEVLTPAHPRWPKRLAEDPDPPALLFCKGDALLFEAATVALVGTRRCSPYGRGVARRLGEDLASCGVTVVSGLAVGIDAAAHAGTMDSRRKAALAVVGTGLDVIYPAGNRNLWRRIETNGLLVTEYPMGVEAQPWRFPARNRIIAALSDVVVVVESRLKGGSLYTVDEALERGRAVMAVPGPVTSPTSEGTNALLAEFAGMVRDADDVMVRLGLENPRMTRKPLASRPTDPTAAAVLGVLDGGRATIERLVLETGLDLRELAACLDRLTGDGWVCEEAGWYSASVPTSQRTRD